MVTPNATIFPQGDLRRIRLPPFIGPEGLGSWHVAAPPQTVRVWNPAAPQEGADVDGYWPIQAVFICAQPTNLGNGCQGFLAYRNDLLSRCALSIGRAGLLDGTVIGASPQHLDFKIKGSTGNLGSNLMLGSITFTKNDYAQGGTLQKVGLIGQVKGILFNQFELWARIRFDTGHGLPMTVAVTFAVDRIGDKLEAYSGDITDSPSGGLPIVHGP